MANYFDPLSSRNPYASYSDHIRASGIGNASYAGDAEEQFNRNFYGYEETLRSGEQYLREARARQARRAEDIGRLADFSEAEAKISQNQYAKLVSDQLIMDEERRQQRSAELRKGANFAMLDQLFRRGKVSKGLIAKANEARAMEYGNDYDPKTEDIKDVFVDGDNVLMVEYMNGQVLPWRDMQTVMEYGENYKFDVDAYLPANLRAYNMQRRAERLEAERFTQTQDRQYAMSALEAAKAELNAWMKMREAAANAGQDTKTIDTNIKAAANAIKALRESANGGTPAPTGEGAPAPGGALGAGAAYTRQAKESAVFKP